MSDDESPEGVASAIHPDLRREQESFSKKALAVRATVQEHGYGSISLPFEALREILGMPADMSLVSMQVDSTRRTFTLTVMSPRLPKVREGDPMPEVQVLSRIRTVLVDPTYLVVRDDE